jgi:hypothetical protein
MSLLREINARAPESPEYKKAGHQSGEVRNPTYTFKSAEQRLFEIQSEGASADLPVDTMFPESKNEEKRELAKSICKSCIHITECLDAALDVGTKLDGIVGGETPRSRVLLLAERNRAKKLASEIQT